MFCSIFSQCINFGLIFIFSVHVYCVAVWWAFICNVKGNRGPFSKPEKKGTSEKIHSMAVELFPLGPPVFGRHWKVSPAADSKRIAKILTFLFNRNDMIKHGRFPGVNIAFCSCRLVRSVQLPPPNIQSLTIPYFTPLPV